MLRSGVRVLRRSNSEGTRDYCSASPAAEPSRLTRAFFCRCRRTLLSGWRAVPTGQFLRRTMWRSQPRSKRLASQRRRCWPAKSSWTCSCASTSHRARRVPFFGLCTRFGFYSEKSGSDFARRCRRRRCARARWWIRWRARGCACGARPRPQAASPSRARMCSAPTSRQTTASSTARAVQGAVAKRPCLLTLTILRSGEHGHLAGGPCRQALCVARLN